MTECRLVEATDAHVAWLSGESAAPDGLVEAPGGVDDRDVIAMLRTLTASLHRAGCRGHWLIVAGCEVVGLCGFKRPPSRAGEAEIGYGIAPSRRRLGDGTAAVALLLARSLEHGASRLRAETAVSNRASRRVLERNGFRPVRRRHDAEDGDLILWARPVSGPGSPDPSARSG